MSGRSQIVGLIIFLIVVFGVAGIGSVFTASSVSSWYANLRKPSWTPPGWVFGPVWTVLYALMAVAAWLVWRKAGVTSAAVVPLTLFGVQLLFNLLWSIIFFGLKMPGLAMIDIVLLWLAILATIVVFWMVVPVAGVLLLPYIVWVSYASTLNFGIWRMNP